MARGINYPSRRYPDLTNLTEPTEAQIIRDYRRAWQAVKSELDILTAKILDVQRSGIDISAAWRSQSERLAKLQVQIQQQIRAVNNGQPARISAERETVIAAALKDAAVHIGELGFDARISESAFARLAYRRNLEALFANLGESGALRSRRILLNGLVLGKNPRVVARQLQREWGGNAVRARTIARTEMLTVYRDATLDTYRQNADVVAAWDWIAESDACPFCEEAASESPYLLDVDFDTHPNAVFAGSTFAPYGDLQQMVSARYSGPAATISVDGHVVTIGPNHPMLTRRGMVAAQFIEVGDELVYDLRHNRQAWFTPRAETHFEEMSLVEDAFETICSGGVNASVATASHDLHGDRVFCKGKVEVVDAERQLLRVLDSCGIEQFREVGFVRPDMQLAGVASGGTSEFGFKRVDLPSARGMGSGGAWGAHYEFLPVEAVGMAKFEGWAFDASTDTSLYCSDGFVVSNCRCTLVPVTGYGDAQEGG